MIYRKYSSGFRFYPSFLQGIILPILATLFVFALTGNSQVPIQLDGTCTATLGNQTALVQQDGSFLIENVSVARSARGIRLPQLYRVRTTCNQEGQTITGQSEFIELEPGQTTLVVDVFPTELDPIPRRIIASATTTQLEFGETAQLTVTALYSDGSTRNVTSPTEGTTYTSTNPDLLSVDENGLVTANQQVAANGLISILNQGNITGSFFSLPFNPNDVDGDGMPNDFEDLFGLNTLVNDANSDLDGDGLSNIDEFNLGTLVNIPDTDGDGIVDGMDSDPLLPDERAPHVEISLPINAETLTEGVTILFSVEATDDGLLTNVELSTDSGFFQQYSDPIEPIETDFLVPVGLTSITFEARATDSLGNIGNAFPVTVNVIPDPLTTVIGIVVDEDGVPVSGANVRVFDTFTGTSGSDGSFSIADVATILGDIEAFAATVINAVDFDGRSNLVPPVLSGLTDVGVIEVQASRNILLLVDADTDGTTALVDSLTADGHTVTRRPPPEFTWNATNPPLTDFDVVVHLNGLGRGFGEIIPLSASTQTALTNFVGNGGGYIGSQWNGLMRVRGDTIGMNDLVLQLWASPPSENCPSCFRTWNIVPGKENHPILMGIPQSFTFFADAHDASSQVVFTVDPSEILMTTTTGGPAVIVRQFINGRVVNFAFAPNHINQGLTLQDPNILNLYINAVKWSSK